MKEPFFIVGAPRSGTTLLRDLLRQHPDLECPEETSFYRWSEPFGTRAFTRTYRQNDIVRAHRKQDGFSEEEFWKVYESARSRREFQDAYMARFLEKRGNPDGRWFEKTPQNTGGLLRLLLDYPNARVIHLYRTPLNVAASIREGKAVGPQSLLGAANIWLEAVRTANLAAHQWPERIIQVSYESLTVSPEVIVGEVLNFVGAAPFESFPAEPQVWPMNLRYLESLEPAEIAEILDLCRLGLKEMGYPTEPGAHEAFIREQNSLAKGRPPSSLKKKLARFRRRLTGSGQSRDETGTE